MLNHKKNDNLDVNLTKKAVNFWNSDLKDLEPKDIMSFPLTKLDPRVPHQGSVLLDRVYRFDK